MLELQNPQGSSLFVLHGGKHPQISGVFVLWEPSWAQTSSNSSVFVFYELNIHLVSSIFVLHEPKIAAFSCFVDLKLKVLCTSWRYKASEFPAFLCCENLPRFICFSNLTFPAFFLLSGTPNIVVAAWTWDHLSFWRFPLFRSHLWSNLRPIPVMRPIVVLLGFPLFCWHFGCLCVLPKLTICTLGTHIT